MPSNILNNPMGGGGSAAGGGLPSGYFYKVSETNDLELWKTEETGDVQITKQNVGIFDVNGSIRTLLNTVYLENSHSISASGQNVVFHNLSTDMSFVPSGWDGHADEGATIFRNSVQSPDDLEPDFNLYGDTDYTNTRPLDYDVVVPFEFNIYKIQYRIAQPYTGELTLTIRNTQGNVTYRQKEYFDVTYGNLIAFGGTYFAMLTGDEFNVKVTDEEGNVIIGYQANTVTEYPFMMYDIRRFQLLQQLAGVQYITDEHDNDLVNRHYFIDSTNAKIYDVDAEVSHLRITDMNESFNENHVGIYFRSTGTSAYLGHDGDDVIFFKQGAVWYWYNLRNKLGGTV